MVSMLDSVQEEEISSSIVDPSNAGMLHDHLDFVKSNESCPIPTWELLLISKPEI
jgi:hypothetical protein